MAFYIHGITGETTPIKNLGWLLKHWQHVEGFVVNRQTDGTALMVAIMEFGGITHLYTIEWASAEVCLQWLARPSFDGVEVVQA